MTEAGFAVVDRLLAQAFDALSAVVESGSDAELVAVLSRCEAAVRRLDGVTVSAVAGLERRGVFAERGYTSSTAALSDLLGWERPEARRRVVAAAHVTPRIGLDGAVLPARLPATAAVFAAGTARLGHVDAITRVLASPAAQRLTPQQWAGVEEQVAATTETYTPSELHAWGLQLVELLDQDGAAPDDHPRHRSTRCTSPASPVGAGSSRAGSTTRRCSPPSPPPSTQEPARAPPTTPEQPVNGRPKPSPTSAATPSTTPAATPCPSAAGTAHT